MKRKFHIRYRLYQLFIEDGFIKCYADREFISLTLQAPLGLIEKTLYDFKRALANEHKKIESTRELQGSRHYEHVKQFILITKNQKILNLAKKLNL